MLSLPFQFPSCFAFFVLYPFFHFRTPHSSFSIHDSIPSPGSVEDIVVSDEEKLDTSHRVLLESHCCKVQIHILNLSDYKNEKVYIYIGEVVNLK